MYLIAVCDDEKTELDKIEKSLRGYEKKHPESDLTIEYFESTEELLHLIREENYTPDLIFMDIYLPEKKTEKNFDRHETPFGNTAPLGMEAANELRDMDYQGKLVFLTTSKEYALEAFHVEASQYFVKPVSEEQLFSLLDKLLEDVEEERKKYILLRIDGKLVRVQVSDIVCCEAQGKTQWLYLLNGTKCLLHMSMVEIYQLLSDYQEFVRIGVAFIVNLAYIGSLNAKEIHMDNGMKIYLPRGAYKKLREQYFNYWNCL